jgi:flagellar basal-body rod protein FlgG
VSRSFFNAFSGVAAYQRSLQQVADNMANMNTNAYKRSEVSFTELLYGELQEKRYAVDPLADKLAPIAGKGTHMYPVTKIFDQGVLQLTDRPLDMAIEGDGYFRVILEDGTEAYTRRGAFFLDESGSLVTDRGDRLDANININNVALGDVVIGPEGQVFVQNETGEVTNLGQINLFTFTNEGGLQRNSAGLFEPTDASGEPQQGAPGSEGYGQLRQYYLEASNVNMAMEMVHLITSQRAFQANVRSLITADELKALTLLVRS